MPRGQQGRYAARRTRSSARTGDRPAPLAFKVTAFVGGNNLILFDLQQTNGSVHTALKGTVKRASGKYGSRLSIKVPDGKGEYAAFPNIQQPAQGVYSALVDLQATISLKKGRNVLVGSTGCKRGKNPFKTTLTYSDNPLRPPRARRRTRSRCAAPSSTASRGLTPPGWSKAPLRRGLRRS